jgi:hypothetical protein
MSLANMPASNSGKASVPHGTRHSATSIAGGKTSGADPKSGGSKPNMPANNVTDKKVNLGHTKHGVGEVPGYLKGHK